MWRIQAWVLMVSLGLSPNGLLAMNASISSLEILLDVR
ncbi:Uncharacterised protein [Segatella copri]|nr:Uncharacterised protein [Segatella copri]